MLYQSYVPDFASVHLIYSVECPNRHGFTVFIMCGKGFSFTGELQSLIASWRHTLRVCVKKIFLAVEHSVWNFVLQLLSSTTTVNSTHNSTLGMYACQFRLLCINHVATQATSTVDWEIFSCRIFRLLKFLYKYIFVALAHRRIFNTTKRNKIWMQVSSVYGICTLAYMDWVSSRIIGSQHSHLLHTSTHWSASRSYYLTWKIFRMINFRR